MKRISLLVTFALILGIFGQYGPAWAQRTPRELRSAIRAYERADFQKAIQALEGFLTQPELAIEVRIEAMQYLAFSRIGLNDEASAREVFTQVLDLKPDYILPPGLSPKIEGVFGEALGAWQAEQPTAPPAPPRGGGGTPVWQIVLGIGLLGAVLGGGGGGGGPEGTSGIGVTVQ